MGKYDEWTKKLPRLSKHASDPKFLEVVTALKEQILEDEPNISAAEVDRRYRKLRLKKDAFDAKLKTMNVEIAAYEELISTLYEAQDIQSLKMEKSQFCADCGEETSETPCPQCGGTMIEVIGGSVAMEPDLYGQVKDEQAFWQWCVDQGLQRSMKLHPSTVQSMVKEMVTNNKPLPDGIELFAKDKPVFRRKG